MLAASFFVFTFLAVIAGLVVIVGSRLPPSARRWAWLPISVALTVVVFADEGYNEGASFGRDYRSTFRDHPNNTFLVKWSYWLNP